MKKLEIIIRPEKLETLKAILGKNEYNGMTVTAAMGCGHQKTLADKSERETMEVNLLPKIHVMTVVLDEDMEEILTEIHEKLSTGNVGDGTVFVSEVIDVMRIRTGERGHKVL